MIIPSFVRLNYWKIMFFIAIIAFEIAREMAVLFAYEPAKPNVYKSVYSVDGYIGAKGTWVRSGNGSPITPNAVTISCIKELSECVVATVNSFNKSYFAPDIQTFDAKFYPDGASYINDRPLCTTIKVYINTSQERVIASRIRKSGPLPKEECEDEMESEVNMELSNPPISHLDFDGHFVPLLNILRYTLKYIF